MPGALFGPYVVLCATITSGGTTTRLQNGALAAMFVGDGARVSRASSRTARGELSGTWHGLVLGDDADMTAGSLNRSAGGADAAKVRTSTGRHQVSLPNARQNVLREAIVANRYRGKFIIPTTRSELWSRYTGALLGVSAHVG
jgi:hypothetical protein